MRPLQKLSAVSSDLACHRHACCRRLHASCCYRHACCPIACTCSTTCPVLNLEAPAISPAVLLEASQRGHALEGRQRGHAPSAPGRPSCGRYHLPGAPEALQQTAGAEAVVSSSAGITATRPPGLPRPLHLSVHNRCRSHRIIDAGNSNTTQPLNHVDVALALPTECPRSNLWFASVEEHGMGFGLISSCAS